MAGSLNRDEFSTEDGSIRLLIGDCLESLRTLPDECVNCCVTSPPYWGLRDYGHDGQIGLESTPESYVAKMVEVFREVRRVLKDDGTLWLNLGDSYAGSGKGGNPEDSPHQKQKTNRGSLVGETARIAARTMLAGMDRCAGLKPKDLCGIPWRVAFALQADGWWLRQDIIWHKPNPMPESVTDRCTKAHEYIFLLSKSARYFYDAEAIEEPANRPEGPGNKTHRHSNQGIYVNGAAQKNIAKIGPRDTRNRRSVWTVATKPYDGAHFATFPTGLIEPCILAGCPEGGTVLDPFNGSGTTGEVALKHGRRYVGCELNPDYVDMALKRIRDELDKTRLIETPKKLVQKSFVE